MTIRSGPLAPVDELADLHSQEVPEIDDAFRDFTRCVVRALLFPSERNKFKEKECIERLSGVFGTVAAFADVLGRIRMLREIPDEDRPRAVTALLFAAEPAPEPNLRAKRLRKYLGLGFDDAVEQMISATPELARTQEEIRRVYERGGFALVRSSDLAVTKAVQEVVAKATAEGGELETVEKVMEKLDESFTGAYSRLVFRNATTRAYAAGRQRQAREMPGVVGLEYQATRDANVRPHHLAADGMIAAVGDPVWDRMSPPNGMNCRCGLRTVLRVEAERRELELDDRGVIPRPIVPGKWEASASGQLPPGAHPDEGGVWGRRADAIYRGGGFAG